MHLDLPAAINGDLLHPNDQEVGAFDGGYARRVERFLGPIGFTWHKQAGQQWGVALSSMPTRTSSLQGQLGAHGLVRQHLCAGPFHTPMAELNNVNQHNWLNVQFSCQFVTIE